MSKYIIGQAGVVVNVVESPALAVQPGFDVLLDAAGTANVGDAYDPKDVQLDMADKVAFTILMRHENLIRELIRVVRSNATLNTAATSAGLPTVANAADVTALQFRNAVKSLLT